ncbi:PqqD family protein [Paenibacillus radicis (ex Xue et al. 2023)]|uniref:PqqD family protein n=1 Tax=Paenibacillus radicis (ex Xue et al. 2023) TaxID=2972489 RepID=A0ABT1YQG1_9BACL|nr:PqqD family protein [Paenibacillus radicis (ex Xue et al. 2023)]MCR8635417.1 PqqD family protein [Paenibacillus radicis (ex Xue et al. 2023)]
MKPLYVQTSNCEAVELDGEWIILNTDEFTVTKLNEMGGFCWSLLSQSQSIFSMIEAIHDHYELDDNKAEQDMEAFLADMMKYGLVQNAV